LPYWYSPILFFGWGAIAVGTTVGLFSFAITLVVEAITHTVAIRFDPQTRLIAGNTRRLGQGLPAGTLPKEEGGRSTPCSDAVAAGHPARQRGSGGSDPSGQTLQ
jgi:hypothetical protein